MYLLGIVITPKLNCPNTPHLNVLYTISDLFYSIVLKLFIFKDCLIITNGKIATIFQQDIFNFMSKMAIFMKDRPVI